MGGGSLDSGYMKRIRERVLSAENWMVFTTSDFADIADSDTDADRGEADVGEKSGW